MPTEAIRRIRHVFSVEGEGKVVDAHTRSERAVLSHEKSFANLERRYNTTIRAQQDYERVQRQVNAAVAQNPALQARANVVLEQAAQKYRMLTVANDNFTAAQTRAAAAAAGFVTTLRGFVLGAGIGAATGLLGGILSGREFITNTIEAENALQKLRAVLEATGGSAGITQEQVLALSTEIQNTTRFGDEAATGVSTLLLSLTRIGGETIPRAVRAITDMSTVMDQDLNTSTKAVARALEGNVTALQRLGISINKDVIDNLLAAGRESEAYDLVLRQLEARFGGAAVAARNTLGGALEGLKNAFGDLFEIQNTENLKAGIEGITAALRDMAPAIQSLGGIFTTVFAGAIEDARLLAAEISAVKNLDFGFFFRAREQQKLIAGVGSQFSAGTDVSGFYKGLGADAFAIENITRKMEQYSAIAQDAAANVTDGQEKAARAVKEHTERVKEQADEYDHLRFVAADFTTTLIEGLVHGENLAQSLSGALNSLSSQLIRMGSQQVVGGLLQALSGGGGAATSGYNTTGGVVGGAGGLGGILGGVGGVLGLAEPVGAIAGGALAIGGGLLANFLGGNQAKKQAQQQAQQQALQQQQQQQQQVAQQIDTAQGYRFQAAAIELNTNTREGALAQLSIEIEQGRAQAIRTGGAAIIAYEELAQAKRLQLEKEWAEKVENLRRDYLDREFAALNDTSTLAGKLAEYERKAAREREDAVKAGGLALVELDRAHAAERGRILRDAAKDIQNYYDGLRSNIAEFTRGLQFGNLSTLSPAEQFLAARNDFQRQLELAQGGDRTAQGGITNVAQTLIEQARNYLGPSVEFGDLVARITDQLTALPDLAMASDPQVQELQRLGGDYFAPMSDYLSQIAVSTANLPTDIAAPIATAVANNGNAAVVAELQSLRGEVVELRGKIEQSSQTEAMLLDQISRLIASGNASADRVGQGIDRLRTDIRTADSSAQLRAG